MLSVMDEIKLSLTDPAVSKVHFQRQNFTLYLTESDMDVSRIEDPNYEQFLADVWVGIVLTLMVLCCVCCMCSCLLYHKFQQWKQNVMEARRRSNNIESGQTNDTESLPSYTIVSGLPSYDEALEQLRKQNLKTTPNRTTERSNSNETWIPRTPPLNMTRLSVSELLQFYKNNTNLSTDTKT